MKSLFTKDTPLVSTLKDARVVVIIDVSNFVHRMINAYKTLTTSDGAFSGHAYGIVSNIRHILKALNSQRVLLVFAMDGSPEKRKMLSSDYKKKRHQLKSELSDEASFVKSNTFIEASRILQMFPGLVIHEKHTEADDIAAAYALKAIKLGKKTCVVSNDRDLWQLAAHGVQIIAGGKTTVMSTKDVQKSLGHSPDRLHIFKSMYGDKSDEIRGVARLPKEIFELTTATDLATLRTQIEDVSFPKKFREAILKGWETIQFNWMLTELDTNVKYDTSSCGDLSGVVAAMDLYECKSLVKWAKELHENNS